MPELLLPPDATTQLVVAKAEIYLENHDIDISYSEVRPWGAFIVVEAGSTDRFIDTFHDDIPKEVVYEFVKNVSPKLLMVKPDGELSWQYHRRRAEIWRGLAGIAGIKTSVTDEMPVFPATILTPGKTVKHDVGTRHTLIGLGEWGLVTEIWQHSEERLSTEDDIVRVSDPNGRETPVEKF